MADLTTAGASWYLNISRQTTYKLRKRGLLTGYLIGSRWMVSLEELQRFKKTEAAVKKSRTRPTFRMIAAEILNLSKQSLWALEKKVGTKISPEVLAEVLREEGRQQGRRQMYEELRSQKRLKYPGRSEAARVRYWGRTETRLV